MRLRLARWRVGLASAAGSLARSLTALAGGSNPVVQREDGVSSQQALLRALDDAGAPHLVAGCSRVSSNVRTAVRSVTATRHPAVSYTRGVRGNLTPSRMSALLLIGALMLHDLRFRVMPVDSPGDHGHGYLSVIAPILGVLCALVLAHVVLRAAITPAAASRVRVRVVRVWPAATAALLAVYFSQELAEGVLSSAHPDGITGVLRDGGWVVAPLAGALGALVAIAVKTVQRLAEAPPPGGPRLTGLVGRWTLSGLPVPICMIVRAPAPLACASAGRAPPALS